MSLMPFCSIIGILHIGMDLITSLVQLPAQSRISSEMRPGCSGLYPVNAQPLWATCSHGEILPVQLSGSKPAFSSGWVNKKSIFTYSNENASVTPGKTPREQHNTAT